MNIIRSIRNARNEKNIPDNKKIRVVIMALKDENVLIYSTKYIAKLSTASEVSFVYDEKDVDSNSIAMIFDMAKVYLPMSSMIDSEQELIRLNKELSAVEFEIARSEKMLSNPGFVNKAPAQMIENEKIKLEKNKALRDSIIDSIRAL
jgi:valyl-tRNA synthetase